MTLTASNLPDQIAADVYLAPILREAPRVLGLMDRESFSPTFGCMDRTYWAWKFTDFAGSRFQEGLCALSFLYSTAGEDSPFHGNARLLGWIANGFDWWAKMQRKSGDFDEAYPFERSLAATAFTSFYLSEAWNFLDGRLPQATADRFRAALHRAAEWLVQNDETHGFLSNHLAAAATALYHAFRICGEPRFEQRAQYFLERILDHQSTEGWYEEYGGADPGYQTHGSFYLVRCLQLGQDSRLADSLERSFSFLAHFVHPDGSLGGEYASRNTQTYYPAAFEMMAETSGVASWIAERMRHSVHTLAAAGLGSVDSYNYFPLLNNMVFAYLASSQRKGEPANPEPPDEEPGVSHFPEAGIAKIRRRNYEVYVGLRKGGVVKAFDRRRRQLLGNDCGYLGRFKRNRLITSQTFDDCWRVEVTEDEIIVEGTFHEIKRPVMKPFRFVGFRLFTLTIGRIRWASYWLKRLLVRMLIHRNRAIDLRFRRSILFRQEGFTIKDRIQGPAGRGVKNLAWVDRFATIHMGSSRYFIPNELALPSRGDSEEVTIDPHELENGVELTRQFLLH